MAIARGQHTVFVETNCKRCCVTNLVKVISVAVKCYIWVQPTNDLHRLPPVFVACCRPTRNSPNLATDHPHVFKKDVVERAQNYAAGLTGGVGAYTNSQGIPAVREVW